MITTTDSIMNILDCAPFGSRDLFPLLNCGTCYKRSSYNKVKKGKELMQQLSLFDSDDGQQPIAAKSIELFTMQQANRYREMGAQLFCTCSDYPRAQISVVRYSQGAFQVKVAGIDGWITPHRVWAEVTNQALEQLKDSSL